MPRQGGREPLRSPRKSSTVAATVARLYGSHARDPAAIPIQWAEREALAKGYLALASVDRNPVAAFFLGKP